MDQARMFEPRPKLFPTPRHGKKVLKSIRPGPGETIRGFCINQDPLFHDMHWDPSQKCKVPCLEGCSFCPQWKEHPDRYWLAPRCYGWMPVLWPSKLWVVCFEISPGAADECPILKDKRVPMRGKELLLQRCGAGDQGPVIAKVNDVHREVCLPRAIDMLAWFKMAFRLEPHPWINGPDGKSRAGGES